MKNIIQNDFSNNRYYLDNPTNFLILRELWLTQPKQYARMLSKKKPTRKRGMDSYNKYHPVYEWIMCMAKKYMINSNTLSILDMVKFILQDRITFQKKHKPKINIYDIYPDTDTTDSKLKEIKNLLMIIQ